MINKAFYETFCINRSVSSLKSILIFQTGIFFVRPTFTVSGHFAINSRVHSYFEYSFSPALRTFSRIYSRRNLELRTRCDGKIIPLLYRSTLFFHHVRYRVHSFCPSSSDAQKFSFYLLLKDDLVIPR